jgi:hypothetical protein
MSPLLCRIYYLNEQMSKHVCVYLDDDQAPQVKITTRKDSVVLNEIQWSKLVKINEYKCWIHKLGDPSNDDLNTYCAFMRRGQSVRFLCKKRRVVLSRKEWLQLMKVASECLDNLIRKLAPLQPELLAWYIKCLHYKTYCKPPVTDVIDFKSLYDELMLMIDAESSRFYDYPL